MPDAAWTSTEDTRGRASHPRGKGSAQQLVEARDRIALLERRLAAQGRARTELVHLVSHELRTPITVISGFARLLQSESGGPLGPEQHRYIDECLAACRRLDRFVDDLLEACPDSPCALSVEPREGDLDQTIRGLLESLAPLLDERGQRVETIWGGACRVLFDGGRIEQVVTNLVTNAVRHGREGGRIRVSTELVPSPRKIGSATHVAREPDHRLRARVSVEDDGPGIAEADRERLFQPYVRGTAGRGTSVRRSDVGSGASAERGGGLGIGLAICRRIIAAHEGEIRVEDSALGGARFSFVLPCVRVSVAEVAR
jgi:signal transduction histidine kinase